MATINLHQRERGGVSIFIVIFTALLVTVVTASFAQLMVRNQQQASTNDLSQSAYDSAMAGVEDAKRVLVKLLDCEKNGQSCAGDIKTGLESQSCDSLQRVDLVNFTDGEVTVGKKEQNQAYTCVTVQLDTPDYKDDGVSPGVPVVIPLRSKHDFDTVRLSWFTKDDLYKVSGDEGVETASLPTTFPGLPNSGDVGGWPDYAPALMRAQLIQFRKGSSIKLSDFNAKGTPNARTLFLYPQNFDGINDPIQRPFDDDSRRDNLTQNSPAIASCHTTFGGFNGYACQVELELPSIGGTREAYLQLQTYYQQFTSYKVELLDGNSAVDLNEVQPRVDSTGRASSLFRRVEANVTLRNDGVSLPFPDAALSVEGNLCKNFFITNDANEYEPRCSQEQ